MIVSKILPCVEFQGVEIRNIAERFDQSSARNSAYRGAQIRNYW